MISSALFLTAGLMASPVIIQDVQASREAGHLRVEVAADGGIDPDSVRTRLDEGMLLIYLGSARVKADNRSWELADGAGEIRAHRHKFETELVVPLAGNGCTGPVELQGSDTGITALVGCEGGVAVNSMATKIKVKSAPKAEQLKELVELPEEAAVAAPVVAPRRVVVEAKAPEAKAETKADTKVETKADIKTETKVEPKLETKVEPKTDTKLGKLELQAEAAATDAALPTTAKAGVSGAGLRSIGMPALLLAALAVGAYLFARRRRTISVRHIQILETASLGPKRSLVVARVGDETLILGTSEAGITLLKGATGGLVTMTTPAGTSVPSLGDLERASLEAAEAAASAFEISQPLEEALADIPEPDSIRTTTRGGFRAIEGGLAGLFNGRRTDSLRTESDSEDKLHERFEARLQDRLANRRPARLDDKFEDVLEDSLEDQELRQKLAAGMSTRVR